MLTFETAFDLALRLLTASPDTAMGRLTKHHCPDEKTGFSLLQGAILQRVMPGENPSTRWGIVRIFMRNLVNRAQAPMTAEAMVKILNLISTKHEAETEQIAALTKAVSNTQRLSDSLGALLDTRRAPEGSSDYIEWLHNRVLFYTRMSVADIDAEIVLQDLRYMASHPATKIPNMGIALASNLFADLGVRVLGKPDLHVLPTISAVLGSRAPLSAEMCIRELIRMTQEESPYLMTNSFYSWLDGGLYPRDIDRIIYLIGSDNFRLDGNRHKRSAPARRELMAQTLLEARNRCTSHRLGEPASR